MTEYKNGDTNFFPFSYTPTSFHFWSLETGPILAVFNPQKGSCDTKAKCLSNTRYASSYWPALTYPSAPNQAFPFYHGLHSHAQSCEAVLDMVDISPHSTTGPHVDEQQQVIV